MLKFKNKNKNLTKLFTAIVHIMTSILCYLIIYEKVTNKCAKILEKVYQFYSCGLDQYGIDRSYRHLSLCGANSFFYTFFLELDHSGSQPFTYDPP